MKTTQIILKLWGSFLFLITLWCLSVFTAKAQKTFFPIPESHHQGTTQVVSMAKKMQTITFDSLPVQVLGDAAVTLHATASSGLPVTYRSFVTSVAEVEGNKAHLRGRGVTMIIASQQGNDEYAPATEVRRALQVNGYCTTWEELTSETYPTLEDVYFADLQHGWAVGYDGTLLKTTSEGKYRGVWEKKETGTQRHLLAVRFLDLSIGWTVGENGVILKTEDGGETWQKQHSGVNHWLRGIQIIDAETAWVVGANGTLLKTEDSGATWDKQPLETTAFLRSVVFLDAQNGYIVGNFGTILHTVDGGETWEKQTLSTEQYHHLHRVSFVNAEEGWVVGLEGLIAHTSDGGETWDKQSIHLGDNLYGLYFLNVDQGWAVGEKEDQGVILSTNDGGETWTPTCQTPRAALRSVYMQEAEKGIAVGQEGTIIKHALEENLPLIDCLFSEGQQKILTVGMPDFRLPDRDDKGNLYVYDTDGQKGLLIEGNTVHLLEKGTLEIKIITEEGLTSSWVAVNDGSWVLQLVETCVSLQDVFFMNKKEGWTVGEEGTILHTEDGGENWGTQIANTTASLSKIQFVNDKIGWITGADNTVLQTTDGGKTWNQTYNGIGSDLSFANENVGWMRRDNKVWKTLDGGQTWTPIFSPQGPNSELGVFAIKDENTGYAVEIPDYGTQLDMVRVYETTDGGNTWQVIAADYYVNFYNIKIIGEDVYAIEEILGDGVFLLKNWERVKKIGREVTINDFSFVNDEIGWVLADEFALDSFFKILYTEDSGQTFGSQFSLFNAFISEVLYAIDMVDANTGWAVGDAGSILKYTSPVSVMTSDVEHVMIERNKDKQKIKVNAYPNPMGNTIEIRLEEERTIPVQTGIYTRLGELVLQEDKILRNGKIELNISSLAPGSYILRVRVGETVLQKHVVKE